MKYIIIALFFLLTHESFSQNSDVLNFGENLISENKLDEAISYYKKHLETSIIKEEEIHLLLGLAEIYKLQLNYDTANTYYVKALEAIKISKNKQLEFLYHVKIAEFYRKRILFAEAILHLDAAKLILETHQIAPLYLAKYYSRKAALFSEHYNQPDSTLLYAQKSFKISKELNDVNEIFYAMLEISGVYEKKKDFKKAINYLENLIDYAESNYLIQNKVDAYINYTRVLIRDKQYNKALNECLKALSFAKENELFYGEILFLDNIRNVYKQLGNTAKAYEYLELRLELTDKYYKIEHNKFLFELEEKYKLTEKENQIKINTLEIENKNKALASNTVMFYAIISLLIAVIIVTILIAYVLKGSKKSNKQLKILSKENEFLLSEANHRINNNLQLVVILISDQLKKASTSNSFQLKSILTKVEAISTLHKHLYKNNDKKKIEISNYLNDVKHSFLDVFNDNNISTNFKIDTVEIPSDYAMYFGLLLTELSINSIKHAFNDQDIKAINVELRVKKNQLSFMYSDNGAVIITQDIKPKLIDKICRQLKIEYTINTENGFTFSFQKDISNA
ncbi:tetratricopeptide repeat-containing sensor histidine kinase [Winogradskyella psychrotolerans]|uniref:tetratricopeptide repeat-containing sensor histidine kinase n=1 Tax=Winogradskyella psychrotolerans TaxID=1344585 RepID=UPI001C06AA6D|nr:sensor histidine kinase [Winogradskyella psychrotolerans]MBU2929002.1 tetratricopeptide repeat protein [Winogradskyella psychrotolerans]